MGGAEGGVWGGVGLVVIWQYSIQYLGVTGTLGLWDAKDYYRVPCGAIGYHGIPCGSLGDNEAPWGAHGQVARKLSPVMLALCSRYACVMKS